MFPITSQSLLLCANLLKSRSQKAPSKPLWMHADLRRDEINTDTDINKKPPKASKRPKISLKSGAAHSVFWQLWLRVQDPGLQHISTLRVPPRSPSISPTFTSSLPSLCPLCLPACFLTQMRSWHWFHSSCLMGIWKTFQNKSSDLVQSPLRGPASFNSCGPSSWCSSKDTSHNFTLSSIQGININTYYIWADHARRIWEMEEFVLATDNFHHISLFITL